MKAAELQPHDWQEGHSPTEFVEVKLSKERTTILCRRRKTDARLIDSLSNYEQDAAGQIYAGYTALTGPVGYKVQSYERQDPGRDHALDRRVEMVDRFWQWSIRAQKDRINVPAVLDVVAEGKGLREVDSMRRKRNGWARENLIDGLRLYCRLRGWPTTC